MEKILIIEIKNKIISICYLNNLFEISSNKQLIITSNII